MAWRNWFTQNSKSIRNSNESDTAVSQPLGYMLEPRMLFDGAIAATVATTSETTTADHTTADTPTHSADDQSTAAQNAVTDTSATENQTTATQKEVAFIDTSVNNYQTLVNEVSNNNPNIEVVLIDGSEDGLQQIADWASTHSGYDAIHIFSHGSEGTLNLGTNTISDTSLQSADIQAELATIGQALTSNSDLMLYGCDVAAGNDGQQFITDLASLTQADIAASTDATGSASKDGNWVLETAVGTIDTSSLSVTSYTDLLTETTLTFTSDDAGNWADGIAEDGDGGSTDIGGITIQIFATNGTNASAAAINEPLTYDDTSGTTFPILSNYTGPGWQGMVIQSADGSEFQLNSFFYANYGESTSVILIAVGYKDSVQVASTSFSTNMAGGGFQEAIVSLGSSFDAVDKVVIYSDTNSWSGENVDGSSWHGINNIVIADPVIAPIIYSSNSASVAENISTSTAAYTPDTLAYTSGDIITYSLSGTDANLFNIDSATGAVTFKTAPNYELPSDSGADNTYNITITATETGTTNASSTKDISIAVTNVNESPTDIALSSTTIGQSLGSNATVGTLSTTDVDSSSFTYSLVSGTGDTDNSLFSINGSSLKANNTSAMSAGTYSVRVQTSDGSGGTYVEIFSITVTDDVGPSVTSVSVPSNGSYAAGDTLSFTVHFDDNVTVNTSGGTPRISLNIGGSTRYAIYASGSGSSDLIFSYTTETGDNDADGISVGALATNGGTLTDSWGNSATLTLASVGSTAAVLVDTTAPTATIVVADTALRVGESSLVTITFNEAVTGFTNADLSVANGTLSAVSSSDGGTTWTATLTPSASITDASNLITLDNTGITDAAGNSGSGTTNSNNYTIDTVRPTATIVVADSALRMGETSLVTITFSEAVTGFTNADLSAANGTLSAVSSSDGGTTWTATLTPTASITDTSNLITLDNTGVTDAAGNSGSGTTNSNNYAIDTARPTATIVVTDSSLMSGETSLVAITFSEAVTGFTNADLSVANGTLSAVSSSDGGTTWTATLTPSASITDASNLITLDNTGITDAAGNAGSGSTDSNNYSIDTMQPTATIVVADTALSMGEASLVTITFSEAVTGFTNADLSVANGTLSAVSSSDGGTTWTATLTPTASITDTSNLITLDNTGVTDAAGNSGSGTTNSNNYAVDTARPTATIVVTDSSLMSGETSLVAITFSEAVTGFTNADLSVANGTLSAVSSDGGTTWTATLTPSASITDASNLITLDNTGITDAAGNAGSGSTDSNNYSIDTMQPTATIVIADTALSMGETSLVTITFSEAVTGFTNADLSVANGTLSAVSSSDGGTTWTATLTPSASITDASNLITLDNTGVTNAAANTGSGTTNSNNYAIDTARPTATITVADSALNIGETSLVTITFSEAVTGFTNADLSVANSTLSAVSSSDGGTTWTATLTPTASITDASNLITLDNTGVTDAAGNTGSGTTNSNNYSIDTEAPIANTLELTNNSASKTLSYILTLSEPVTGIDVSDFTIVTTGDASAVIESVTAINSHTYQINLNNVTGAGSVQLILNSEGSNISDSAGNIITQELNGNIHTNHEPTSNGINAQTATGNRIFNFVLPADSFSDSDASNTLTFNATLVDGSALPAWLSFDPTTRTFSGKPGNGDTGSLGIRVTAIDNFGSSVSSIFQITVEQSVIGGDPEFKANDGAAGSLQELTTATAQSQLTLITSPSSQALNDNIHYASLFSATSLNGTTPTTAAVFGSAYQGGGATNPSELSTMFHSYAPGRHTFGETSTLAGLFGSANVPENTPLEIFSTGSWNQVMQSSSLPSSSPTSVFGVPVFSQQLKELDRDAQQITELENALKNITQLPV